MISILKNPKDVFIGNAKDHFWVDLVSFERYPDKEYQYVAYLRDHFTRFSWTYPLRTKEAFEKQHNINMEEDLSKNFVRNEEGLESTNGYDSLHDDNGDFNNMDNEQNLSFNSSTNFEN
ncbi:28904_t:CDS:2 [Gigaspora margarita]|uniref:28904_t:CDS:1 n=1 Tax=Gigaspora margarita TaxID=4874 RepID=A0ABN7UN94_GIGMA|nr:28904_t:CDS:2 [Gigaspora margarita]